MPVQNLLTPVARLVWGNPAKARQKKDDNNQPIMKDGVPVMEWVAGLAIPKAEFDQYIRPYMAQEAATLYPNGTNDKFSWKFVDGDGVDSEGKPYSTREGYAGCYVLAITTVAFAPQIHKFENGAYRQMQEQEVKTGDYLVANINLKAHNTRNGGIYINPNGFEHVGYGQEIISGGADAQEMFGGRQYALPAGASATPLSSAPAEAQMPVAAPQAAPAPMAMPQPAHDFVANAAGQPVPQQHAAPVAHQQPVAAPMGSTATPATSSPTNTMPPGIPPAR